MLQGHSRMLQGHCCCGYKDTAAVAPDTCSHFILRREEATISEPTCQIPGFGALGWPWQESSEEMRPKDGVKNFWGAFQTGFSSKNVFSPKMGPPAFYQGPPRGPRAPNLGPLGPRGPKFGPQFNYLGPLGPRGPGGPGAPGGPNN